MANKIGHEIVCPWKFLTTWRFLQKKKKEKSTEFSFGLDWNYRGVSNNSCLGKDESSNPWTYLGYH